MTTPKKNNPVKPKGTCGCTHSKGKKVMATPKKKKPVKPKGSCGCKHSKGKK